MARPVTLLVVFFVGLNLFSGMLASTGVAAMLGIQADVGGDSAVQDRIDENQNVSSGAPTGSTLFGMYNVLSSQIASLFGVIYPGLIMLYNAGVPAFIVGNGTTNPGFLGSMFSILIPIAVVSFLRGWDL